MPEGPEVARAAKMLDEALAGSTLLRLETRFKAALAFLKEHPGSFDGARILKVAAVGKNILFCLDEHRFMRAHLRMYGRWNVYPFDEYVPLDRRMRAHFYTDRAQAVFNSGARLDLGFGDPMTELEHLSSLGPDILVEPFDAEEWRKRMLSGDLRGEEIGVALLNQRAAAGIGNYLKSEIMWVCGVNPWTVVENLTLEQWECMARTAPELGLRALHTEGWTLTEADRARVEADPDSPGHSGRRHYVFRRTNKPCHRCRTPIRQKRQGPEKGRITYWCPACQGPPPG